MGTVPYTQKQHKTSKWGRLLICSEKTCFAPGNDSIKIEALKLLFAQFQYASNTVFHILFNLCTLWQVGILYTKAAQNVEMGTVCLTGDIF